MMKRLLLLALLLSALLPGVSQAAVTLVNGSAAQAVGSTSLSINYPASIVAGNLLVACMVNKYPPNGPSTPSGWTLLSSAQGSGGSGAAGADSGDVYTTVFVREADASDVGGGPLVITITSGNSAIGIIDQYTKTLTNWSYAAANGADTSFDTSWSITGNVDPGVLGGDLIKVCTGVNTDAGNVGSHAMSQSGITFGAATEILEGNSGTGDDTGLKISTHAVTSGTSSGLPTYTATFVSASAGASVILRMRDGASAIGPSSLGFMEVDE